MIEYTKEIDIARSPEAVFAFIDAEDQARLWLGRWVQIARTSPGDKAVGTTLRYTYKQAGRKGQMDGVVTAYEPGKRLEMKYQDRLFDVIVGFDVAPNSRAAGGAHVTEHIAIEPKALVARLMSPILGRVTRWQTDKDVASLKRLLEAAG